MHGKNNRAGDSNFSSVQVVLLLIRDISTQSRPWQGCAIPTKSSRAAPYLPNPQRPHPTHGSLMQPHVMARKYPVKQNKEVDSGTNLARAMDVGRRSRPEAR